MNRRVVLMLVAFGLVVALIGWLFMRRRSAERAVAAVEARAERIRRVTQPNHGTRVPRSEVSVRRDVPGRDGREPVRGSQGRQIEIVSLGPTPVGYAREALVREVTENADVLGACLDAAGGSRALAAAMAAADAAAVAADPTVVRPARPPRIVMFDIASDGTIDPSTVTMEPPMPETFAACFRTHLAARRMETGENRDGARVQMPLNALVPNQVARDGGVH